MVRVPPAVSRDTRMPAPDSKPRMSRWSAVCSVASPTDPRVGAWPRVGLPLTAVVVSSLLIGVSCLTPCGLFVLGILGACNVADGQRGPWDWLALCVPVAALLALEVAAHWPLLTGNVW